MFGLHGSILKSYSNPPEGEGATYVILFMNQDDA